MNWTQPRKSQKFSQQAFSACKKIQTTCLNTPIFDKDYKPSKNQKPPMTSSIYSQRNCPYHFNHQDHICLTCRKSICIRCAITYCQQHLIKQQKQMLPVLMEDLRKIYVKQKIDEIETKLGQSLQRQEYFQNKMLKLMEKIQDNFNSVIECLNQKKLQIMDYFNSQFQDCFSQYNQYDQLLRNKLIWLNKLDQECHKFTSFFPTHSQQFTIQKIDELTQNVKNDDQISQVQKKLTNTFLGKSKFTIDKLWSEEKLEKVLYEVQNISFKLNKEVFIPQVKVIEKKKRIITQTGEEINKMQRSAHKSPGVKNLKASGRMIYNRFNSGRKNKEERLQKSQFI